MPTTETPPTTERLESYLDDTVRQWLGVPAGTGTELPRLPATLARRFLRDEELERSHRDQWGNWEFSFSESFRDGSLLLAEVDRWAARERERLAADGVDLAPLWPDGKSFAVCLTHDVDLVSTTSTPSQVVRSMKMSLSPEPGQALSRRLLRYARPPVRLARGVAGGVTHAPSTSAALEQCVTIEQEAGVTSSYFFTVPPGRRASRFDCVYGLNDRCVFRGRPCRIAEMIAQLAEDGFDVGLHGSYHSATEPGLLADQRAALSDATGLDVITTRQHFLHWDVKETPRLQTEAGFLADTTLGFNRGIGFRAGTSLPFTMFDRTTDSRLDLIQVPLIVEDGPLFRSDGLELDRGLAETLVHQVIDEVAAVGGAATFLFHPNSLMGEDFLEVFRSTIGYSLARGAWVTSLREIQSWWRQRAASLAQA